MKWKMKRRRKLRKKKKLNTYKIMKIEIETKEKKEKLKVNLFFCISRINFAHSFSLRNTYLENCIFEWENKFQKLVESWAMRLGVILKWRLLENLIFKILFLFATLLSYWKNSNKNSRPPPPKNIWRHCRMTPA